MNLEQLPSLLGHSVYDPAFDGVLRALAINERPEDNGTIAVDVSNKTLGVHLEFQAKEKFMVHHGSPKSTFSAKQDELVLTAVTFDRNFTRLQKDANVSLPFKLLYGEQGATICVKLKRKQYLKQNTGSFKYGWWFLLGEYEVLTALDENESLLWFRVVLVNKNNSKGVDMQKMIRPQNLHLHTHHYKELESMKVVNPTLSWVLRMNEGDPTFTQKNIRETATILEKFIDALHQACKEQKALGVYNAVKKTINNLNKLSRKYDCLIDNREREELILFVNDAVRLTGLQLERSLDITWEWREW
ncbi:hypothetical protein LX64_01199 [Chitinophaga skermanii]|uniref:Uncharacterized protein n=1 Tax=Chitinophaga skermanii TaxID=331697 RepID=A0A327QV36_9BACT|nr:hypothetical protein [Chitinophaga skermanii]RAJ08546.1 hypothetical protein LX64_01199 [Chitinophaga skermanii]